MDLGNVLAPGALVQIVDVLRNDVRQPAAIFHFAQRQVPGVGLGLYISRGLVEGHGGKLVVEKSDVRKGTIFAISLPLAA